MRKIGGFITEYKIANMLHGKFFCDKVSFYIGTISQ